MELSSSNIKKILIFSPEMESYFFQPKLKKQKKSIPGKCLIFQETEILKKLLHFRKRNPRKTSYILGSKK